MQRIGIIGAGAWGTALAQSFCAGGKDILLWALEPDVVNAINERHENTPYLPRFPLLTGIKATSSFSDFSGCEALLIVTPAQHMRKTLIKMKETLKEDVPLVICAKGIEIETSRLMSQVAEEILPHARLAVLTGPTFASEIARGLPCAVTLAAKDMKTSEKLVEGLNCPSIRMYASDDILGAQVAGAVKNVIAIGCGIIEGKKMGESARAALVTRGLAEMGRLAKSLGAQKETLFGMCGVGDLILTCSSMQSRNFSLGYAIGQGRKAADILKERSAVTEGVYTAKALSIMARKQAVDMPIAEAVNQCLSGEVEVDAIIRKLLVRPLKAENA